MWPMHWLVSVVVAATLSAGGAWLGYKTGRTSGEQHIMSQWNEAKAEAERMQKEELLKARQREQALQALTDRLRQEKRDEARRLAREYAADLERLRNRPERPADSNPSVSETAAAGAGPATGCTGSELFRPDAAFLVGEAARADQLRIALGQCEAQYNELMGNGDAK